MSSRNRERRKATQKARAARGRARAAGRTAERAGAERAGDEPIGSASPVDAIDALVAAMLNAMLAEDGDAIASCVDILADPPGGSRGRRLVNRVLAGWFDNIVEDAWERGWQPADAHRVVSRRASPAEARLVVDAMAAQMRRYDPVTVDKRWKAQLHSLGVLAWRDRDDDWLDAWADNEGRGRAQALTEAHFVLNLLAMLPRLEVLCPPPGTARREPPPRAAPPTGRGADPRMLDRVRALLAKAESTGFAEEAEALTAKAQQLMTRHSIDEALLAAGAGNPAEPAARRVGIDNPYEVAKASLLDVVATVNRCRTVWSKHFGFSTVVGFEGDLDAVELLYTSLLVQATTAMMRAGSRQDRAGRSRTRSFRQSFLASFAIRIGQRLRSATEQVCEAAAAEAGEGRLLPALAARTDAVREATDTMFPRIAAQSLRANDSEGWACGRAAADLASLRIRDEVTGERGG
ncbi:DUF2786 domain-containing protein [Frankia sp. AgB32]|uniref:DUF2786 domain-containing protein n=1 Tax=Frankia sp. AgB32 TaxID=631119 RepID=UPI0020103B44|nr:DUF2786 domain-containing protein [Frankia sp. AgB32]MCK9894442.1 DUF2786 domain-containing protein [Frankia sp. AgB32]